MLGYPETLEVLSQPEIFSSAYGTGIFSDTAPGLISLNLSDPPLHTPLRAQVDHWLRQVKPRPAAPGDGKSPAKISRKAAHPLARMPLR